MPVRDAEVDEVWAFIGKKEKRVKPEEDQNMGDCYTFVAIERNTKLVLNVAMGKRGKVTTDVSSTGFGMQSSRAANSRSPAMASPRTRTQFPIRWATVWTMPCSSRSTKPRPEGERKYSPAEVASVEVVPVCGRPDPERICASIIERSNLSLRVGQRRWTRLTNAIMGKWENHSAAMMLWYAYYNFCRVHRSLRVTPAMEAGITDRIWELKDLLA